MQDRTFHLSYPKRAVAQPFRHKDQTASCHKVLFPTEPDFQFSSQIIDIVGIAPEKCDDLVVLMSVVGGGAVCPSL